MESKKEILTLIGVNILEAVLALVFLLVFVVGGIFTSYMLDSKVASDIAILTALMAGLIALNMKIKQSSYTDEGIL